jgi:error-prone DNA polymerase
VGFNNPDVPWSEIERTLSDRRPGGDPRRWWTHGGIRRDPRPDDAERPEGADGGDSPAWSRHRPAYVPPEDLDRGPGPAGATARPSTRATVPPTTRATRNATRRATPYAELHCHSNFSFLDGASHPEELAEEAARLGLEALALTDHDGLYGVVRFAEAARTLGVPTVFGAELSFGLTRPQNGEADPEGHHLLVLARDPEGYARLASTLSTGHLAGREKGRPDYSGIDWAAAHGGHWLVLTGCRKGAVPAALVERGPAAAARELARLIEVFGADNVAVELSDHGHPLDSARNDALAALAVQAGVPLVATNNVHYAAPDRRRLATALAAVRARRSLDDMDGWLPAAAGAHLRSGDEQARRFARWPGAVERAAELGRACAFDLALVAPQLPPFPCPDDLDEMAYLRQLVEEGAARRYGPRAGATPDGDRARNRRAWRQIDHELDVIEALGFPGYFLVVWDIVEFCRRSDIYCQGRGSAANSAVCYALGVTNADAVALGLLFERFLSPERDGPPDIDIDIESGRREEAIQYVYRRHGRRHAAQVANVISYRARSAVRDMAKALGYSPGQQDAWSKQIDMWASVGSTADEQGRAGAPGRGAGERAHDIPEPVLALAREVEHAPRHLGIHSGGMVICDRPIVEVCPVEWGRFSGRAALRDGHARADGGPVLPERRSGEPEGRGEGRMTGPCPGATGPGTGPGDDPGAPGERDGDDGDDTVPLRTVLQWDKDDCAAVGLVKFDLLGLGMLEALHHCVDFVRAAYGDAPELDLAFLPHEDPEVYAMLCRADSVGVFQVESRAQMATLPRLRPHTFYDLVVEVALIRPGPIQGGSVHPYIRRRHGLEEPTYLHPLLKPALEKTLGVPLFQEQLMQIAIDVAGFTPGEADELRQAMGAKRSQERMERLRARLYEGMAERGVTGEVADRVWEKLAAFASYGFPESHSVSFAYLVYASSWLKRYYPAAFCAALLDAQPMGFYSSHSLVQDARRHGVEVRTPDLAASAVGATLEVDALPAVRRPARPPRPPAGEARSAGPETRGNGGRSGALDGIAAGPRPPLPQEPGGDPYCLGTNRPGESGSGEVRRRGADRPGRQDPVSRPSRAGGAGAPPGTWGRGGPAVRIGLGAVRGLGDDLAGRIVAERDARGPYADPEDLVRRVPGLSTAHLEALATAGAFGCFGLDRRRALWVAGALAQTGADRLSGIVTGVDAPTLPGLAPLDEARADLWATGISPEGHPTRFVRAALDEMGAVASADLVERAHGSKVTVAGVVTHRQRPATAGGTTFVNLEDESGLINVVVSKGCWIHHRRVVRTAPALLVRGRLERVEGVTNVIAERIEELAPLSRSEPPSAASLDAPNASRSSRARNDGLPPSRDFR